MTVLAWSFGTMISNFSVPGSVHGTDWSAPSCSSRLPGTVKYGQHRKGRNRRLKNRENRGQETKKSPAKNAGLCVISGKSKKSLSHKAFLHFRGVKNGTGRQDHTTSPSARRALVFGAPCVHRIPPRVRDDREPPLCEAGRRGI
jgi:hypothetical protein